MAQTVEETSADRPELGPAGLPWRNMQKVAATSNHLIL
jgi:hypothetical protein